MENKTVTMAHGAGGKQTSELIDEVFKAQVRYNGLAPIHARSFTVPQPGGELLPRIC